MPSVREEILPTQKHQEERYARKPNLLNNLDVGIENGEKNGLYRVFIIVSEECFLV